MEEVQAGMLESRATHAVHGAEGSGGGEGEGGLLTGSTHVDGSVEGYAPGGSLARDAEKQAEKRRRAQEGEAAPAATS